MKRGKVQKGDGGIKKGNLSLKICLFTAVLQKMSVFLPHDNTFFEFFETFAE